MHLSVKFLQKIEDWNAFLIQNIYKPISHGVEMYECLYTACCTNLYGSFSVECTCLVKISKILIWWTPWQLYSSFGLLCQRIAIWNFKIFLKFVLVSLFNFVGTKQTLFVTGIKWIAVGNLSARFDVLSLLFMSSIL